MPISDDALREIPQSEEVLFRGILIDVSHMQVKLPDGKPALREIVHHCGGVGIVPVDETGNVYLVRQHRVAVDEMTLEIPAGKLDSPDEDLLSAAVRELEEETGLRAGKMRFLTRVLPSPGFCTERLGIFLATGLSQHEDHPDAGEFLGVEKMPLKEAVALSMNGTLQDAKTALGLLMAWQILHTEESIL